MAKMLFIISNGFEKAGRATRAFQFAKVAREKGNEVKVFLIDDAIHWVFGLILMTALWVVGTLLCILGVTFLPVVGVIVGLSIISVGTWLGLYFLRLELYEPFESKCKESMMNRTMEEAMRTEEEKEKEPGMLEAA